VLGVSGCALLAFYASSMSGAQAATVRAATAAAPTKARAQAGGGDLVAPLTAAAEKFLGSPVALGFDGKTVEAKWSDLALVVDPETVQREAARLAHEGKTANDIGADYFASAGPLVPVALDREKALTALVDYKTTYDRAPVDARADLEHRVVVPEQPGFGIDIYGSLGVLEQGARAGSHQLDLVAGALPPAVTREKLGNLDVSHIMGYWETHYPQVEKDRNYNLKVAAEKLNGHILMPGEEMSFNAIVGDRTEKEGYRVAHVIQAGEMIDGLAGGTCQISSTLHAASFFAGLEMTNTRPHSRPSAYITMGLDATVVYPTTDYKMKNPYDFPVAIRYVVAQGIVRVEILGKQRPYDKIQFEREILEEKPFETITREDSTLPIGATVVEQAGFPGYKLERRRVFFKDGKKVKTEKRKIEYPPTTEYLRIGSNPDPNLEQPVAKPIHGPMDPGGKEFKMAQ
jgi:vancomycin resistance protein YoaR